MKTTRLALTTASLLLLAACGNKGSLVLPQKPVPVPAEEEPLPPPPEPANTVPVTPPSDVPADAPAETPVDVSATPEKNGGGTPR